MLSTSAWIDQLESREMSVAGRASGKGTGDGIEHVAVQAPRHASQSEHVLFDGEVSSEGAAPAAEISGAVRPQPARTGSAPRSAVACRGRCRGLWAAWPAQSVLRSNSGSRGNMPRPRVPSRAAHSTPPCARASIRTAPQSSSQRLPAAQCAAARMAASRPSTPLQDHP